MHPIRNRGRWSPAVMLVAGMTLSACNSERTVGPHTNPGPTAGVFDDVVAAGPTQTMTGETFSGTVSFKVTPSCLTANTAVSLNFTASGVAAGPYSGTFVENGAITLNFLPPDPMTGERTGVPVAFNANFSISSPPNTTINGIKTGLTSRAGTAICDAMGNISFHFSLGSTYVVNFPNSQEKGPTEITISGRGGPQGGIGQFEEVFGGSVNPPAKLVLNPPTDVNTVDAQHCVVATVTDATGAPVSGVTVIFTVSGSVNTSGKAKTDAHGNATFCYQGPPLPGEDLISAFADTNGNGRQDPDEPFGRATKTWILPVTTPNCEINITNGGWITAMNGDRSSFGGNAKSSESGDTQGEEEYQDHGPAQPMNVHSISVLAIVCDEPGKAASIYGDATVDGSGSFKYRIKVRDVDEPGVGNDTYWLILGNGYNSGEQVLEGGNVQVHKQ